MSANGWAALAFGLWALFWAAYFVLAWRAIERDCVTIRKRQVNRFPEWWERKEQQP